LSRQVGDINVGKLFSHHKYPLYSALQVGYTNAGKSSLIEALTGHDLGSADSLFATLDATSRSVHLPSGAAAILSDTVGFISDLPVQLLDAFKVCQLSQNVKALPLCVDF